MNKIVIIKDENNIKMRIINPLLSNKEFYINIPRKEKDKDKDKEEGLISLINSLNKKIDDIKDEYEQKLRALEDNLKKENEKKLKIIESNYENKIKTLLNKISSLEDYIKNNNYESRIKALENLEKQIKRQIDSTIINNTEELCFINNRLKVNFKDYNLIYRATRDGPKTSDFNEKCKGKNNQLIILKTTKGLIFGGYTQRGFQNTNDHIINDDSVFLFSIDNKKIYNIKKGSRALYENSNDGYGIYFDGPSNNPIYLGWKNCDMLLHQSETCTKEIDSYSFTKDYELNNGEKYFHLSEIEVFHIVRQ